MAKNLNVSLAFTADASQAKAELNALKKSLNDLVSGTALRTPDFKFTKDIQEATRAVAQLKVQLDNAVNVKTGNLDLTKFSESMQKSGMSLEKYQNQLYQLGPAGEKAFADLTRSITMADVPLKRSSKLLDELWTTMKNTARWQLTSSAMHGFMGAIQSAYGYAQNLNESLNNIRIVTGASTEKMAAFAKEANTAAKMLSTTTTEYTNASLIFYQQGLSDSQVKERTDITIKMANAAGASVETVSDQLTAIWNNFYDGSKSLEYYADVMTALGAATASSTDEIAGGLEKFAAIGETIGLSYEYAASALATITSNTRQSEEVVGTALKTIFARIQGLNLGETLDDGTTLNKYSEALDKVGISIFDASGEIKNMDTLLDEMANKWDNISKAQQIALAQTVAGTRQYTQLVALMDNWDNGDSDSMTANLDTAYNSSGTLQNQADIYAESWEAANKRVQASAEAIYSAILNDEFFIELTNGFAEVLDGIKTFIDSLGGIKGVLLAIGSIVTNVFSKQIGQGIENAIHNIKMMTKAGKESEFALKEQANQTLIQGYKDNDTTSSSQSAAAYTALAQNQLNYIKNAQNMSEEEQAINQILMDRNRLLADEAIAAGDLVQKTEEKIAKEESSLQINAQRQGQKSGVEDIAQQVKELEKLQSQYEKTSKASMTFTRLADFANLHRGLQKGTAEANKLSAEIKETVASLAGIKTEGKGMDTVASATKKLVEQFGLVDDEISTAEQKAGKLWVALQNPNDYSLQELGVIFNELGINTDTVSAKLQTNIIATLQQCGYTEEEAKQAAQEYITAIQEWGPHSEQAAEALRKLNGAVENHNAQMDKTMQKPIPMAQAFSKATSAVMAVGQAFNTVKGILEVFNDEEATTGEKILALISGMGMLVPAIMSVVGGLSSVPVASAGANAALVGTGTVATATGTTISLAMWQITLIVAAITAVVAIIIACADAIQKASPEGQFKAAAQAAEQAADAANKVQEEYENVVDTLEGLDSGIEKIHEMERGTLQWRQAIIESNNSLIELLSTYGMLDSKNFTTDADGIMQITDEAREELLTRQSEAVQQANNANYAAQVNKNNAKMRMDASDTSGELTLMRSTGDSYYDAVTDNSQLSADIGMAIATAMAQGRLDNDDLKDTDKLTKVLGEVNGLYGQEAEILARQIASSDDLISKFGELGASVTAATEANRILNNQIVESNFGSQIDNSGFDESSREDLTNMMGKNLEQRTEELYEKTYKDKGFLGGGMTDEEVQKLYAEAMGWATDTIDNQNGNKAKYYAKDGSEIGVISDEVARRYLAQQKAIEEMGGDVQGYINTLNDLIQTGNNIGEGIGEALGTFAGGQQGDLSSLTQAQLNDFSNSMTTATDANGNVTSFNIGDLVVDEAYAQKLGYDTVQAYYDAIQAEIEATNEALDTDTLADSMGITTMVNGVEKTYNTAGESFKELFSTEGLDLENMTAGAKQDFANAYKSIFEAGGEEALGIVDGIITAAGDNASEVATLIAETDWTNWDSAEQFAAKLEEMGISIEGFDIAAFIEQMKEANNATKEFNIDNFRQEFASISELVSDLEFGDIISAEEFESLGEGFDSYFTLMADGTYKLTADAQQFYNVVMQKQRADLLGSIQSGKANLDADKASLDAAKNSMGSMDSTTIGESQMYSDETGKLWYKGANVDSQIDFIEQMGGVSADQIAAWKEELSDGYAPVETLNAISEAAGQCGMSYEQMQADVEANEQALQNSIQAIFTTATSLSDLHNIARQVNDAMGGEGVSYDYYAAGLINLGTSYENCADEIREYQAVLNSGNDALIAAKQQQLEAAVAIGESAALYGIEADVIEDVADGFLAMAEAGEEKYKILQEDAEALKDASVRYIRLNEALDDLNSNYDSYAEVLEEVQDATNDVDKAMAANSKNGKALQKSLAGLLGTTEDFINADLLDAIDPKDFKKAAEGDADAIERIRDAFIDLQAEAENIDAEGLRSELDALEEGVVVDINADTMPLLYKLIEAKVAAGAGAAEIEALLSGFNIDADVSDFVGSMNDMVAASAEAGSQVVANTSFSQDVETTTVDTPVTKEDVGFTETHSATPMTRTSMVLKDGSDTPVPVTETYYNWTKSVSSNVESETGTNQETGTSVTTTNGAGESGQVKGVQIKNAHKSSGGGVSGSRSGRSTGGGGGGGGGGSAKAASPSKKSDVVDRYKEIDDKIADSTRTMDRASKAADRLWGPSRLAAMKKVNEALEENIEDLKQKRREAEENLKTDREDLEDTVSENAGMTVSFDNEGNISNYDEIMNSLWKELETAEEKAGDEWDDDEQAEIDAINDRIEAVKAAIEQYDETNTLAKDLDDEIQDKIYEWQDNNYEQLNYELEFKLEIEDSNLELVEYYLGKIEDDIYATAEAFGYMNQQVDVYTNKLEAQENYVKKLEEDYLAGRISLDAYKEGLRESQSAMIENLEALQEQKEAMQDYYGNVMSMALEEIHLYTDEMEELNSVLDHYSNILELVGKQEDYATKGKVLQSKAANLHNEMQVQQELYEKSNAEAEKWAAKMATAVEGSNEYETYKKNWIAAQEAANEAQENMLSKTEEWAEAMKAVVENELAGLAKTMEESLTGGTSFDELLTSMERRSSLQEEYLTTTNQIYETNKLMRQAQQEIDKTTNSVAKRKLANFISETEQMQNQTELSQYELDIQQAKYDLLLAEIALEEAQSAKSTVRLQRDSEGNFGYVYTADQSAVGEAEQNLADKQNALYNLGLEGANDYSQKYAETMQEAQDAITELTEMWMNGEIESEEEYQRRKAEIQDYYYEKLKQYSNLYQVALTTDSNVIKDAWSTDFNDMMYKTEDWKIATDDYFAGAAESMQTWADVCGTVLEESGLDDVSTKVEEINTKSEELKNTLIGEDGESGVVGAMMSEVEAAGELSEAYISIQNQIDGVIQKYEEMLGMINKDYTNPNTPVTDPAINPDDEPDDTTQNNPTQNNPTTEQPSSQELSVGSTVTVKKNASKWASGEGIWSPVKGNKFKVKQINGEKVLIGDPSGPNYTASGITGWIKKTDLEGFATGGYTGDWEGSYGKLAMLHQKELVLNAGDTENFLAGMDLLDKIVSAIDLYSMNSQLGGALSSPSLGNMGGGDVLEQQVHIEASFPGVQDRNEIEEAFNTLINRASQYANRK